MNRVTPEIFRFRYIDRFPALYRNGATDGDEKVSAVLDEVYGMFSGVETLWGFMPIEKRQEKVYTCFCLLCAWYITDTYPEYASSDSNGGMPITEKSIGDVRIKYDASVNKGGLSFLKSNPYGVKAYNMLKNCSDSLLFYARS